MDKGTSTLVRVVVGTALLAGTGLGVRAYTSKSAQAKATATKDAAAAADRAIAVVTVPVAQKDMPIYLEGLGNVLAFATVTVHTQIDGRIDRIAFTEGQSVKKGDLLAQIDPRPYQVALANAEAARARDAAQLGGAAKNLERYTEMNKNGLASQQQVDDQTALVAQLKGTVATDQAAIDSARLNIEYCRITSPIDGVTGIRNIDQGNLVHASDPSGIVVLTTLDPIAVIFTLPQDNLTAIAKEMGQGTVAVEALSRDGGSKLATGKLALIDNQIQATTATIKLKAVFANPDRALWPNAFVKTRSAPLGAQGRPDDPGRRRAAGPDGHLRLRDRGRRQGEARLHHRRRHPGRHLDHHQPRGSRPVRRWSSTGRTSSSRGPRSRRGPPTPSRAPPGSARPADAAPASTGAPLGQARGAPEVNISETFIRRLVATTLLMIGLLLAGILRLPRAPHRMLSPRSTTRPSSSPRCSPGPAPTPWPRP